VKVWVKAFRGTLHSEDRMFHCAVLGASNHGSAVGSISGSKEVLQMCHEKLVQEGLSSDQASQLLATITAHWWWPMR